MILDKSKIVIVIIIFVILTILLVNYFGINMEDNKGFRILQREAIYEGIGNKDTRRAQGIE